MIHNVNLWVGEMELGFTRLSLLTFRPGDINSMDLPGHISDSPNSILFCLEWFVFAIDFRCFCPCCVFVCVYGREQ